MRPLDGITVLDLTRLLPGGAATLLLANFGADVIKIEEPRAGDYGRSMPPFLSGEGAVFHLINRGKKSVALDLKDVRGKEAFLSLASRADVVIESFRPGVMARLGLDYDTLSARNGRLIYVAITGYGQQGPRSGMAGHDINYQALGGTLDITGEEGGPPVIPGVQIADLAGGAMQAVIGVLLALAARAQTGRGQMVDVSMMDGAAWMLPVALAFHQATGTLPERGAGVLTGRYACYHLYRCADGRWISVGALEPKFWEALCNAVGKPDLIDLQFATGDEGLRAHRVMEEVFLSKTRSEWERAFDGLDVCCEPVLDLDEVASHPQIAARGLVSSRPTGVEVRPAVLMGAGWRRRDAPGLGEHTVEILAEIGVDARKIETLRQNGVI